MVAERAACFLDHKLLVWRLPIRLRLASHFLSDLADIKIIGARLDKQLDEMDTFVRCDRIDTDAPVARPDAL